MTSNGDKNVLNQPFNPDLNTAQPSASITSCFTVSNQDSLGYFATGDSKPAVPSRHRHSKNASNVPPVSGLDVEAELCDHFGKDANYQPQKFFGIERPQVSADFFSKLTNYSTAITAVPADPEEHQNEGLGTVAGVYLPTIQTVLGVLLFIRLAWVIGTAGVFQGFIIVFVCCLCTFITAISLSAVATNGKIPAGGPYYLISRNLGPEFGGAVGVLFYFATVINGAMEILGAIEVLVIYILPELSFFGDLSMAETKHNNFRFYGTLLLILLTLVVWRGVKVVNKFAAGALVLSFMCQLSVYLGYFVNYNGTDEPSLCLLGRRVVMSEKLDGAPCTNQLKFTGPLAEEFCNKSGEKGCLRYLVENNFTQKKVVLGLASHALTDNTPSSYVYKTGHYITDNGDTKDYTYFQEDPHSYFLRADAPSSFIIALGIFFPSVVGILAGCNRSGDLKDPQTSIPRGTLLACCTTSFVYLSNALLLAGSMDNVFLRDKFGDSLGGRLAMGVIAWPSEWVFLIGALTSTIASAMHNITGAPRLLQALAMDETIPFLRPLMVTAASGEPTRGLIVTFCLTQIFVLIGNLDELNPLLSCFFLMCYGFINLACALQTLLKTPNWRPRFKFYHWAVSASGLTLCIALMFMCSWLYALISMAMAVALYKYIEFNGAKKEWGDGVRGLALSAARYALLRVEEGEPHVKNWRPQILVFVKFDRQTATPKHQPIMSLASQLKTGKGLIMPVTALKGAYVDLVSQAETVKKLMRETMAKEKLKGFSEVLITDDILSGLGALLQISGVGALKPNTVIMGWPNGWRSKKSRREHSWMIFMDMLRNISAAKMTVIVPKGIQFYPGSADKLSGTIDIWWIVHDGGLLVLLPFLLQRHRTWQNCKLRIFTVVGIEGNSIKMKAELNAFLYHARINAEVEIVELDNSEITPYIYERTMVMEQRSRYLSAIGLKRSDSKMILEELVDAHRQRGQLRDKRPLPEDFFGGRRASMAGDGDLAVPVENPCFVVGSDTEATGDEEEPGNSSSDLGEPLPCGLFKVYPTKENIVRMHTAVKLNEMIRSRSQEARLVVLNLPSPPKKTNSRDCDANYLEFLEAMTEGLRMVMLVRGGGHEVITIYS